MGNRQIGRPTIPTTITVHLGKPEEAAENIRVDFIEYIKNVACSEIYPSWPEASIRSNVLAEIHQNDASFPLVYVWGCFDTRTEIAVKNIQEKYGLDQTGRVGPLEWMHIVEESKKKHTS